jgi:hypothetical protein
MRMATEANPLSLAYCKVRATSLASFHRADPSFTRPFSGAYNSLYRPTSSYVVPMDYMKE